MEADLIDQPENSRRIFRKLRMTQRRLEANRRNAMRSTGPRTAEGKARVRLNALRHGFRARDDIFVAAGGEQAKRAIAEDIAGIIDDFHPVGAEENAVVAEMALNTWKSRWAFAIEMDSRWWEKSSRDPDWPQTEKWLYALMRYNNRADRIFHRGLDVLLKAAKARKPKNKRTNPLARRPRSSPASLAGEAVAARKRGDGEGSGPIAYRGINGRSEGAQPHPAHRLKPVPLRNAENERTNPLARILVAPALAGGPGCAKSQTTYEAREDSQASTIAETQVEACATSEKKIERSNPLEDPTPAAANSLSALTLMYWRRERRRAKSTRWQN